MKWGTSGSGLRTVRILLVEDDEMLGEAVRDGLRQKGYVVDWVRDGGAALAALSTSIFSALVLDIGLPTVSDDGPGIPSEQRTCAFERFYRIPGSSPGGSGLGLSIVGRVVELPAGDIELSEPACGTGLIVTVCLPVRA